MQQVNSSNLNSAAVTEPQIWRTDEEDLVNALVGAVWYHHMNRRARFKAYLHGLLVKVGLFRG